MEANYNGVTYPMGEWPEESKKFLMLKGLRHYLGNEVSAKASNWKAQRVKEGTPPSEEEASKAREQIFAEHISNLESGRINTPTAVGRPKRDPLEALVESITKNEVLAKLRQNGLHVGARHPGEATEYQLNGATFTFQELVERWWAKPGNAGRITKEAKAKMAKEAGLKVEGEPTVEALFGDGPAGGPT